VRIRGWIAALVVALMLPAAGYAQNAAKAPAPDGKRPVIEFPAMSYNFGDIYHQDSYVHSFTVKNKGTADLMIEEVKPG
jgi:hypothetical protein